MKKTKLTGLKDGRVKVEIIGEVIDMGSFNDDIVDIPELPQTENWSRDIKIDDIGTLCETSTRHGKKFFDVWLELGTKGVCRHGTFTDPITNGYLGCCEDRESSACGVRRVESIAKRKRGLGWVIMFSSRMDLKK